MDEFDKMLWAYRAVFTQTHVGGGNVRVIITARERMVILYGVIGPDVYGADRTVQTWLTDSADNTIARTAYGSPVNNERIPILSDAITAIGDNAGAQLEKTLIIGEGEIFIIQATALATDETMTIAVRALVESCLPSIATTGSTGTVTTTTTYSKVI